MGNDATQLSFLNDNSKAEEQPVECLGMTFKNEDERREYFREELRKKLPELKKIEGYPIGEDEDIIALSDPPYYTACPNPWLSQIVDIWNLESDSISEYEREPFSTDVSEGKNDAIYNAHSYHTKVPYKAIMRYILHYTNPGDIIYDAFSGSGMTGVAAKMCEDINTVRGLGYSPEFINRKVGKRNSILSDISPAATFIGYNYNKSARVEKIEDKLTKIISSLKDDNSWKYATLHEENQTVKNYLLRAESEKDIKKIISDNCHLFGEINYVVWSEMYSCPNCQKELTYWEATVSADDHLKVTKQMNCLTCGVKFEKKNSEKIYESHYDKFLKKTIEQPKTKIVKISYFNPNGKRAEKVPDEFDKKLIEWVSERKLDNIECITKSRFFHGSETDRLINQGINQVYDLYYSRTLNLIGELFSTNNKDDDLQFLFGSTIPKMTKLNRFMPQHGSRALVGPMANTLYIPPLSVENNFIRQLNFQFKKIIKAYTEAQGGIITTQSSTSIQLPDNTVDYMFFDPPFGANINYSELSYSREAWLGVTTEKKFEAIENKKMGKTLGKYTELMSSAFEEAYRILKPNRWITVEFSNTQASVWNALQYVIQNSGFVIASVDALDKKRGGFHAMISPTAVKQDLVISAYKPSSSNVLKMKKGRNTEESAWIFVEQHLDKLPVFLGDRGSGSVIVERTPRILYDRMIAYHIQTGLQVPISSQDFQSGLLSRFPIRDGMVFLDDQVVEFDKKRLLVKDFSQLNLFVSDENSAIEWLRQQLLKKPQTRQDLHPKFMKELHTAKHEILPELDDLLNQNFLRYNGGDEVPSQILTHLRRNYKDLRGLEATNPRVIEKAKYSWFVPNPNKQADLEKLREKSLLREYENYLKEIEGNKRKLRAFRTEAIRAGFKKAYSEKDFESIVRVGDRIPEKIIQEDDKLLMYYDNALIRLGI